MTTPTSLFGGNPSMSHYTAVLPSVSTIGCFKPGMTAKQRSDALGRRNAAVMNRKTARASLVAAGWKERYFQFPNGNEKRKFQAKLLAEAEAKFWLDQTGIRLEVLEGCFL